MSGCPKRQSVERQNRAGKTVAGSQRYRCMRCGWKYTLEKKPRDHAPEMRQHAVQLYVDGMNLRRIGRHLKVHHRTISLWVQNHAENLPEAPMPE